MRAGGSIELTPHLAFAGVRQYCALWRTRSVAASVLLVAAFGTELVAVVAVRIFGNLH